MPIVSKEQIEALKKGDAAVLAVVRNKLQGELQDDVQYAQVVQFMKELVDAKGFFENSAVYEANTLLILAKLYHDANEPLQQTIIKFFLQNVIYKEKSEVAKLFEHDEFFVVMTDSPDLFLKAQECFNDITVDDFRKYCWRNGSALVRKQISKCVSLANFLATYIARLGRDASGAFFHGMKNELLAVLKLCVTQNKMQEFLGLYLQILRSLEEINLRKLRNPITLDDVLQNISAVAVIGLLNMSSEGYWQKRYLPQMVSAGCERLVRLFDDSHYAGLSDNTVLLLVKANPVFLVIAIRGNHSVCSNYRKGLLETIETYFNTAAAADLLMSLSADDKIVLLNRITIDNFETSRFAKLTGAAKGVLDDFIKSIGNTGNLNELSDPAFFLLCGRQDPVFMKRVHEDAGFSSRKERLSLVCASNLMVQSLQAELAAARLAMQEMSEQMSKLKAEVKQLQDENGALQGRSSASLGKWWEPSSPLHSRAGGRSADDNRESHQEMQQLASIGGSASEISSSGRGSK
jgi:hypothetical protein